MPQSLALVSFEGYCGSYSTTIKEQGSVGDCSTFVKHCAPSCSGCTGLLLFFLRTAGMRVCYVAGDETLWTTNAGKEKKRVQANAYGRSPPGESTLVVGTLHCIGLDTDIRHLLRINWCFCTTCSRYLRQAHMCPHRSWHLDFRVGGFTAVT